MKIFKYVVPERIDVLANKEIRFSQVQFLNDPFEFLPFVSRIMDQEDASTIYDRIFAPLLKQHGNQKVSIDDIPEEYRSKIPAEMLEQISKQTILEALSNFPQFHPKKLAQVFAINSNDAGINFSEAVRKKWQDLFCVLCLTQVNDSITMWSHYAANHSGFVIEFDSEDNFFNQKRSVTDPIRCIKKVNYETIRPNIKLFDSSLNETELINFQAEKILLTKSTQWAYEQELRMILPVKEIKRTVESNGQTIHLHSFESSAVRAVYLGVNTTKLVRDNIIDILRSHLYQNVRLFQGVLNPTEYQIDFHELN